MIGAVDLSLMTIPPLDFVRLACLFDLVTQIVSAPDRPDRVVQHRGQVFLICTKLFPPQRLTVSAIYQVEETTPLRVSIRHIEFR